MAGFTKEYPELRVNPAPVRKRVGVVGGGPAGIQAVKTLRERGHDVTLYERGSELGGQVIRAAAPEFKTDLRQYLEYLRAFAEHSGAKILTDTEATPETLAGENFDALVVAVGAKHFVPKVPGTGAPNVSWAAEASAENVPENAAVVIVGAGAIGIEAAVELGRAGRRVTVIELAPTHGLGSDMSPLGGGDDLLGWLRELNIPVIYNAKLTEVRPGEVVYADTVSGGTVTLAADRVLLAAGMVPLTDEAQSFRSAAPNTEVYLVGDCFSTGDIRDATRTAFDIARQI
jgi:NADPH-dependent 2,4-dienoyl-CoA reductase/sulfur reductase-like enzyme